MRNIAKIAAGAAGLALVLVAAVTPAAAQTVTRVYTQFDSDKCKHTPGQEVEDYGSWRCPGHASIDVRLSAGDQRMFVTYGRNGFRELAAEQTFPGFNNVYSGTVEWRIETLPNGKTRPFATILRWNVREAHQEGNVHSSGRVLVVTRLGPGGVCHVGYVDARANAADANELAVKIADERARGFKCGKDKPVVLGKVSSGISMPGRD